MHTGDKMLCVIAQFYYFKKNRMSTVNLVNQMYARQFLRNRLPTLQSRIRKWEPVTLAEMKGFLAVIFNTGLIRKPTLAEYWSTRNSQTTPWFKTMFPKNRFQHILNFFYIVDNKMVPKRNIPHYRQKKLQLFSYNLQGIKMNNLILTVTPNLIG